jgi:hypothetical protein
MTNYTFKYSFFNMQTQDVVNACAALVKIGKKPSIGLVRAKLAYKVPLATVVKGIQQFQSTPTITIIAKNKALATSTRDILEMSADPVTDVQMKAATHEGNCVSGDRVLYLEQQIEALSRQLKDLQTQVLALSRP